MEQGLQPGDFLIFQLEAGFALLRLLAVDDNDVWHVAAYSDFFPSVETAEAAIENGGLRTSTPHIALTRRAFDSTQVARISNQPLDENDVTALNRWRRGPDGHVTDRSVRLVLGLR